MSRWLLDTNIISELMRVPCNENVARWIDRQRSDNLFNNAVTVMEIRQGLAALPFGQRRNGLETRFATLLAERFVGRVLPFDHAAAERAALLSAQRRAIGRPVDFRDTMIAGIALANRIGIVTRNTADFRGLDVAVVDPFDG
ncbi:type II toxin-antitoxin system VapC family toxin [Sandarakinorhabdus sp.]|uniref:type II toxin-antitoxin system VapC family toxin n=1 Tax=Sandarakinorhabdus sp. TaxID=1916663 RepID=UPI003F71B038